MTAVPPDPLLGGASFPAKASAASALQGPRTPVTRWNRRYLLAGGTALAAIVALAFYLGFGGADRAPTKAGNQPAADVTPTTPELADRYPKGYSDLTPALSGAPGSTGLPPPGTAPAGASAAPAPKPVDPAVAQALAQAQAARQASPFFDGSGGPPPAPPAPTLAVAEGASGAGAPAPAPADVQPANGQADKRQFAAGAKLDDYLQTGERGPVSPWEVKAGTIIPAALITAINSDLPGEIIAQVTEPVYDHVTGRTLLIPQGSRLIGQYDSQIAYGQERALIAWNRIVMPDGRSINIGAMEGADLTGASGLHDRVDGHFWQLARGILLSTLISVGASSAQDAGSRSSGDLVLNSAGTGVANEAEEVGSQITSRDLNRQPTITIRAGWPVEVLVSKDMILAPYP
ncbi:MAG: TrbI/VirB10 family protein [Caulobacteraceae bacterium]|nr:TrbI/VirB10 family protein [Caulobacteraceae bacterium]